MRRMTTVAYALLLVAVTSSGALAKPKQSRRILVASYPPAELRIDGELICTTPCVVLEQHLKGMLTLSDDGPFNLTYRMPLPLTPPGGVADFAQDANFEIGEGFMMFRRSPGLMNDNIPLPAPPPQPMRSVPSPEF